jgi:hypothetical protein
MEARMTPTDSLLAEREETHGDFAQVAEVSQQLRRVFRSAPNWECLTEGQREIFEMWAGKQARILCGDPDHLDHWDDMGGYSRLGSRLLGGDR